MSLFGPDYEANRRRLIDQARQCPRGLGHEQLVPGAIVTCGPCKHTGDRSWIGCIWRVLATNGGHIALECVRGDYARKLDDRVVMLISEREWYPAEHMLDAMQSAESK